MKGFIKKLLGITALEERVEALEREKSQTPANPERDEPLYGSVMDEWFNGREGNGDE